MNYRPRKPRLNEKEKAHRQLQKIIYEAVSTEEIFDRFPMELMIKVGVDPMSVKKVDYNPLIPGFTFKLL